MCIQQVALVRHFLSSRSVSCCLSYLSVLEQDSLHTKDIKKHMGSGPPTGEARTNWNSTITVSRSQQSPLNKALSISKGNQVWELVSIWRRGGEKKGLYLSSQTNVPLGWHLLEIRILYAVSLGYPSQSFLDWCLSHQCSGNRHWRNGRKLPMPSEMINIGEKKHSTNTSNQTRRLLKESHLFHSAADF